MTLSGIEAVLKGVCERTYHLAAPKNCEPDYIVWHEYGARGVRGDDRAQLRVWRIQIDAYSQRDDAAEGFFREIMEALDDADVSYAVVDIGFDEEALCLRCIIQCEDASARLVMMGG